MTRWFARHASPVGTLLLEASYAGLSRVSFDGDEVAPSPGAEEAPERLAPYARALDEYFARERRSFPDVPLDLSAGTDFERRVWHELLRIPYGTTVSYAELARRLGDPKCIRAAGRANGKNPVAIVVPCHRVIATGGGLGGYAGGLAVKARLLALEGARRQQVLDG